MKKETKSNWATVNRLATLTHADPRHIARWMELESVPSKQAGKRTVYNRVLAVNAISLHQRPSKRIVETPEDPEAEKLTAILNSIFDSIEIYEVMVAEFDSALQAIVERIAKGDFGLSEEMAKKLLIAIVTPWSAIAKTLDARKAA
jgi:hypothetical protein